MSRQTEDKLEEWAKWWDERKREGVPVEKKIVVSAKMIEGLFDILAYCVRDLRELEGRPKVRSDMLWLPHGMTKFKDDGKANPEDTELGRRL